MTPSEAISVSCEPMTPWEARDIADEHIDWWRRQIGPGRRCDRRHVWGAQEAWQVLTSAPYPGGGWERVRAEMIRWLLRKREDEERWAA